MSEANDILVRVDQISGANINYRETTTWYDGTTISDDKCDGVIYRKKDGKYYRKTIANDDIPKVDNINNLRNYNGYFEGQVITLLGYYSPGDKLPLQYKFTVSNFDTTVDNGGSTIKSTRGTWIAQFGESVDVRDYGAFPSTDPALNFSIIKRVIETHDNVVFRNGQYNILHPTQTSYFGLRSNSVVTGEDASIKVVANSFTRFYVLYANNVSNVKISNLTITGDKLTHTGTTGEWGYGIFLMNSNNVEITNVLCNEHWGDGITLNGGFNIKIYDSIFDNNRRQGCSIGKVGEVDFFNCKFSNTNGTNPGYGVDIENDYAGNNIKARFYNCLFDTNGLDTSYPAGFALSTHLAANPNPNDPSATTTRYEVEMFNPVFVNCGMIVTSSDPANGYLKVYNPSFYKTVRSAILLVDHISNNFFTQIIDPKFYDCVTTTTPNSYDNVIATQINGAGTVGTKNAHIIRPYITNTLATKNQAVRIFEGSTRTTGENFKIEDLFVDKGYTFSVTLGDGTQPTLHPTFALTFHKDSVKGSIGANSSIGPNFNLMNAYTSGTSVITNTMYIQVSTLKTSDSIYYLENRSLTIDTTVNFGTSTSPTVCKVYPYSITDISQIKIKPGGWIKYKKTTSDSITIVDHSGLIMEGMTILATETVPGVVKKSTAVANVASTNSVPLSFTDINTITIADLVAISIADLVAMSTADLTTMSTADVTTVSTADATDAATTQALVNELKAKINVIVNFINELKSKNNTTVPFANELKAKANLNVTLTNDQKTKYNLNVLLTNDEKNRINISTPIINDIKSKYNVASTLVNEIRAQVNAKLTADRASGQQT